MTSTQTRNRLMGKKVLLIEDDRLVAVTTADVLRLGGLVVTLARTAKRAFAIGLGEDFDLVIADMILPDGRGSDVACQILAERAIPFVALTAFGSPDMIEEAFASGAANYIVKPVDAEELLRSLARVLSQPDEIRNH